MKGLKVQILGLAFLVVGIASVAFYSGSTEAAIEAVFSLALCAVGIFID